MPVSYGCLVWLSRIESIRPGYYMNKKHWLTISLTDDIPDDMLTDLANKSYELVVKKLTKANKAKLQQQADQDE